MAAVAAAPTGTRSGTGSAHDATGEDLRRLAEYPHVVVSWVDDDGFPTSVATTVDADPEAGSARIAAPAGMPIPADREVSVVGSHIHPTRGGYDERRYLQLWGRVSDGVRFEPVRAWGWDETEMPFFEYSERSVPQSRRYLTALSAEKGRTIRPQLSFFWLALRTTRLPFLSATAVPVLLGISVAASHGAFTWWTALLTLIGASFAHLAINVTNDIFDTLSGADDANPTPTQFSGGSRVAIYDLVSVRGLGLLAAGLYAVAAVIGLALVAITGSATLLWIGVAGIALGIAYTAPPLKLVYRGLGEVAVAIGFGPVMLLGAYVVQTQRIDLEPLVLSLVPGILIALILFVNEIPDRRSDAQAGKRTLPTRFSPAAIRRRVPGPGPGCLRDHRRGRARRTAALADADRPRRRADPLPRARRARRLLRQPIRPHGGHGPERQPQPDRGRAAAARLRRHDRGDEARLISRGPPR